MDSSEQRKRQMSDVWIAAGRELEIRVFAPYPFASGNSASECVAYLPDFGGPGGMLLSAICPPEFLTDCQLTVDAHSAGYYVSFISADSYAFFDGTKFKEALIDWGFYGPPDMRPTWIP